MVSPSSEAIGEILRAFVFQQRMHFGHLAQPHNQALAIVVDRSAVFAVEHAERFVGGHLAAEPAEDVVLPVFAVDPRGGEWGFLIVAEFGMPLAEGGLIVLRHIPERHALRSIRGYVDRGGEQRRVAVARTRINVPEDAGVGLFAHKSAVFAGAGGPLVLLEGAPGLAGPGIFGIALGHGYFGQCLAKRVARGMLAKRAIPVMVVPRHADRQVFHGDKG